MAIPARAATNMISKHIEELLEDLVHALQVPESRYEAAERSYHSVGSWLQRNGSHVQTANPQVYIQGSFQLGTVIRPISEDEEYDVDLVCELSLSKAQLTQAQVKEALGLELRAYAERFGMERPKEGRRCWTLNYADSAKFHLDTLAAIPDGPRQRLLLQRLGRPTIWAATALAVTDRENSGFYQITDDWPHSNPKGFADWFRSCMAAVFDARRRRMAMEARASVEAIPEYKVLTPLQSAIQILKRHRDVMFVGRSNEKPISIILTTLAAQAYQQETTIADALYGILGRMDQFILSKDGVTWVPNPTDLAENFADRWRKHPERERAFCEWLDQARQDFDAVAGAISRTAAAEALIPHIGRRLVESAQMRRGGGAFGGALTLLTGVVRGVLNPAHRQSPPWNVAQQGSVGIERAIVDRKGFRSEEYESNGSPLPKHCSIRFEATTNVPKPYQVYWQVVNTGREAETARGLRGGFDEGVILAGKLTRKESTLYAGKHSIECFIVKDGLLAASSGQFIVNIR